MLTRIHTKHLCKMSASPDSFSHASTPERIDQGLSHMKKRRITRACDLCRRRKIKCDGSHPCASCSHSNADCTFSDQPKKRQPQKGQRYIETLEKRLERMESLLKGLVPEIESEIEGLLAEEMAESFLLSAKADKSRRFPDPQLSKAATSEDSKARDHDAESSILGTLSDSLVGMFLNEDDGSQSGFSFLLKAKEYVMEHLPQHEVMDDFLRMLSIPSRPRVNDRPSEMALLPSREIADIFVQAFLDHVNVAIPLFHTPSFLETYQNSWTNANIMLKPSWLATYLIVLALGCQADAYKRDDNIREEFEAMAKNWADAASGLRDELLDIGGSHSIRALLLIMIYTQTRTDPKQVWWQLGTIIRCALGAGLHRSGHRLNLDPVELQERCNLFWTIYIMDKILSNIVGLPGVLQDDDIDQLLPQPIDDHFITRDRVIEGEHTCSISLRLFLRIIELAKIQSKIQKKLYKIVRSDIDIVKLVRNAAELDQDVVAWKENMRPDFDLKPELSPVIYAITLYAHLLFHHTVIILHRQGLLISLQRMFGNISVPPQILSAHPRLLAGGALCVSSARSTIQVLGLVPPDILQRVCLHVYYPYLSALVIFTNFINDPSQDNAMSDIALIEEAILFFRRAHPLSDNPYIDGMASHLEGLVKLSRQILSKVSSRKAKRSRVTDLPSDSPEENPQAHIELPPPVSNLHGNHPFIGYPVSHPESSNAHKSEWTSSSSSLPLPQCSYAHEPLFGLNLADGHHFRSYDEPSYFLGDIDWEPYPFSEATSHRYPR
ncbi:putative transcriptional regulatory protein [Neolecta irregularis DAH-3]|uniref:Putative transcriptional regulatory protein n=1 Tax=Neolecta irregularis (strain DAH-3) TaxID=1198029 RepID=A0A1U7LWB8_NEOID|nr:putative transcriptional regulatory protein [Neolecta irregularis DAH-3]|eukprot:OLL26976.1 putative transcriptional regulatory protein [Neolecta irregularis DAH-3]